MVAVSPENLISDESQLDSHNFTGLIDKYKGLVFAIVLRFVSSHEDAEDIAQEVFIQLYRSLPQCQPDHLKAWIGRIAMNKAIDWKRKQARTPDIIPGQLVSLDGPDGQNPEYSFIRQEREAYIRKLCASLAPHYRRVLIKYHFQDKTYQQIAREEGISMKTVESRLYRARKLLRQLWEEGRD